ncbi:MAG: GLPGLI family protein [Roseburia sp.]|nr:GLPGLI family protein [Roseburia sp.]MCM1419868.1 GLPGLI family protein [Bacteroides sp.]
MRKYSIIEIGLSIKVLTVFALVIITTAGNAQKKKETTKINNKRELFLSDSLEIRTQNSPKRLSPYDKSSIGKALNPMMPNCRNVANFKVIDKGFLCILYAYNASDILDSKTYDDLQRLEIGGKYIKYYSSFVYEADSSATAEMTEVNQAYHMNYNIDDDDVSIAMSINGKHQGWSRSLFSEFFVDLSHNNITEYCRMPEMLKRYDCYYVEPFPQQNWQIDTEKLNIGGYLCQKATCYFRGRSYTAWFAIDIPISYGPWKFRGLPGLIMKIYDDEKKFIFECVGIKQQDVPIIQLDCYRKYRKTSRKNLDRTLKRICENYYTITGLTNVVNNHLRKYDPMEMK